jgi:hypothetical protein
MKEKEFEDQEKSYNFETIVIFLFALIWFVVICYKSINGLVNFCLSSTEERNESNQLNQAQVEILRYPIVSVESFQDLSPNTLFKQNEPPKASLVMKSYIDYLTFRQQN